MDQNERDLTIDAWGDRISDTITTLRDFGLWLKSHDTLADIKRNEAGAWIRLLGDVGLSNDWIAQDVSILPGNAGALPLDQIFEDILSF